MSSCLSFSPYHVRENSLTFRAGTEAKQRMHLNIPNKTRDESYQLLPDQTQQ